MEGVGGAGAYKLGSKPCKKCILIGSAVIVIAGNVAIYLHTLPCAWAQQVANVILIPHMIIMGYEVNVWEIFIRNMTECDIATSRYIS